MHVPEMHGRERATQTFNTSARRGLPAGKLRNRIGSRMTHPEIQQRGGAQAIGQKRG